MSVCSYESKAKIVLYLATTSLSGLDGEGTKVNETKLFLGTFTLNLYIILPVNPDPVPPACAE